MEDDSLHSLLREWVTPQPDAALDARTRLAWRNARPKPFWRNLLTARVSVPVPMMAALVLVLLALLLELRPLPHPVQSEPGYVTRLGAAGFQPLPHGEARVVPMKEAGQ